MASNLKFIAVALLLAGGALFLRARNKDEIAPPAARIRVFSLSLGNLGGERCGNRAGCSPDTRARRFSESRVPG